MEAEGIDDLTSDHTPVLLTLSAKIIKKIRKQNLDQLIDLNVRLSTPDDLELQTQTFIDHLRSAASEATPTPRETPLIQGTNYPAEIRDLIKD